MVNYESPEQSRLLVPLDYKLINKGTSVKKLMELLSAIYE